MLTNRPTLDALNHAVRGALVLSSRDLLSPVLLDSARAVRTNISAAGHLPGTTDFPNLFSAAPICLRAIELYERARSVLPPQYPPVSAAQLELAGKRSRVDEQVSLVSGVFKLLERGLAV